MAEMTAASSALMPVYARADLAFVRGEGAWLYDEAGRAWLDFGSGIAVNALGHSHPRLVAALQDQAARLWHVSNLYRVPGQEQVAEILVTHSFAERVFFCNSGAEAWEGGLKLIRRHFAARGQPERNRLITVEGAFHGRTMAAISAAGGGKLIDGFAPLLDGFDRVPFGNLNALRDAIGPHTAGIAVEPILGEGGIRPAALDYLQGLRAAADEFGLLLFFDEVQTGIGRTGHLFAHEAAGVTPDVMCIAKGLGGGFPVGAILATSEAARGMTPGTHGTTFGGNPLAMAVAGAVLEVVLAPGFLDEVRRVGALLRARLDMLANDYHELIAEIRGTGLMLGVRLHERWPVAEAVAALRAAGLLTVPAAENTIRLLPPLIIAEREITDALDILDRVCRERAGEPA